MIIEEKIAVLIPCYNEGLTVADVVQDFRAALPEADIYVYDNNSTDDTVARAEEAGAIVRHEPRQGKGFVVRSIFHEVDADYYLLVDGDSTYPAHEARALLEPLFDKRAHMTVGARLETADHGAFRALHQMGNHMITRLINWLFQAQLTDVLSGYRGFSRDFVKTTPLLSSGFEIETELTLHALDARRRIIEVPVRYGVRPSGSVSKLNTFRDGWLILGTILGIFKDYRPFLFFGALALLSLLGGLACGTPVIYEYLRTGIVNRIPLSVLAASMVLISMQMLGIGVLLKTMARDRRLSQELWMLGNSTSVGRNNNSNENIDDQQE